MGGKDVASLVLRAVIGGTMVAHGVRPGRTLEGTMAVAARSVHVRNGFFITGEGYEYVLNLGAASVALAAIGPGRLSVDHLLGRGRPGKRHLA